MNFASWLLIESNVPNHTPLYCFTKNLLGKYIVLVSGFMPLGDSAIMVYSSK